LKNLIKAKGEFSKMLKINYNDIHCLIEVGIVWIYDNKITKARMYFNQVFTVDPQNWLGPFYLALIEYKFKNYSQSKILALIAENLNVTNFYPKYLLAKLLALSHKPYLSMLKYQEALQVRSLNSIPFGLEVLME
jgi:tetratricopeptide (TPR) repeat protein